MRLSRSSMRYQFASNEPEAFFDFEKAGWSRTIERCEQTFGPPETIAFAHI
jgi:hypothetical protein